MLNKDVILVGYSGHGFVVAEAAILNRFQVKSYTELKPVKNNPFNLKYLGFEGAQKFTGWEKNDYFILGIGDNQIRQKSADIITSKGKILLNVLHPSISLSRKVNIGSGNFFARNVSIPLLISIGDNCILNTGCIIEHECEIGTAVHIGPLGQS